MAPRVRLVPVNTWLVVLAVLIAVAVDALRARRPAFTCSILLAGVLGVLAGLSVAMSVGLVRGGATTALISGLRTGRRGCQ